MKAISLVAALFAAALAFDSVDAKTTVPVCRKVLDKSRRARIVSNTLGVARRYVNGKRVHDHVQVDAVGPITPSKLTDWSDELYTTPITLGTRQAFTVDLDTGSSDIWLRGPNCISLDGSCNKWNASLPVVNTDDSTLRSLGFKWSTQYGSGGVAGEVYSGPLQLGGAKVDLVDFGVSTSEEGFNSPGDGLLGMGFASISNIAAAGGKNTNFIDELGLGDDSQFAFYFSDASDGDYGELTIGGVDEAKFNGTMKYVPLNAETYWQFNAASATYTVGSTTGKLASTTKNAIADTGTTLLILDTAAANEINKAIGAGSYDASQGIYPISCSKIKGPPITITIDNIPLHITAQQYVMNVGANQCISGVTQGAASSGVQIWGDTFLRAVYTLFDKANNQLGFAQAVHPNLDEFEAEF